jgi:Gpi18-like mannosyltransferase
MALAGVVISNVSFFIALVLIYRLTTLEWGENVALTTLWVIALCPAAPFFGAVYTESLFIALMAATFLAARRHHWWLAGLAGGAAALLRNPGFLIAGALLLEAWQNRQDKRLAKWITWLIPLGAFIGVQVYFWVRFGNPMAGLDSQGYFHRTLDWPWVPLLGDLRILINGNYNFGIFLVTISGLLFTLLGLASPFIGWRKISLGYYLLIFGITLMNLVYARQIPPYTISATRYLASLFPVAQMIALSFVKIQNSQAKLLFFGLYFFVFVMFNLMFGDKGFLG